MNENTKQRDFLNLGLGSNPYLWAKEVLTLGRVYDDDDDMVDLTSANNVLPYGQALGVIATKSSDLVFITSFRLDGRTTDSYMTQFFPKEDVEVVDNSDGTVAIRVGDKVVAVTKEGLPEGSSVLRFLALRRV